MSMPSSSASVAVTPSRSPSSRRCSISRRCAGVYPARYGASRCAVAASTRSTVKRWISSAALRLFAKQIVLEPPETRLGEEPRRVARARCRAAPSSASSSGGFQSTTSRSARGALSVSITVAGLPVSDAASSPAFAIVADARRNCGLGAVGARQPAQAPQDVRHVGAEHAAVDVRLVHHDPAQVVQHVAPAVVARAARRRGACPGS